jgi:hypothetical protein
VSGVGLAGEPLSCCPDAGDAPPPSSFGCRVLEIEATSLSLEQLRDQKASTEASLPVTATHRIGLPSSIEAENVATPAFEASVRCVDALERCFVTSSPQVWDARRASMVAWRTSANPLTR